jgi:hypothetical protein
MAKLLAVLLVGRAAFIGCSDDGNEASPGPSSTRRSTTTSSSTTTTTLPPTTTTTVPPEWPKEVPMASIDSRFQFFLGAESGKTVAVELAPGVYAERGVGPLGTREDYAGYVGLCADVQQYSAVYPGGHTCW